MRGDSTILWMLNAEWIIEVVATNVRMYRAAIALSQEDLADKAGVHRTYMSQIERGLRNPTVVVLTRMAMALGVRPDQLLVPPLIGPAEPRNRPGHSDTRAGFHKTTAAKKAKGK